jgi:hypothetical protein
MLALALWRRAEDEEEEGEEETLLAQSASSREGLASPPSSAAGTMASVLRVSWERRDLDRLASAAASSSSSSPPLLLRRCRAARGGMALSSSPPDGLLWLRGPGDVLSSVMLLVLVLSREVTQLMTVALKRTGHVGYE